MIISYLGRGIAHEQAGIPCQDSIRSFRTETGVVMALSDGASGSARAEEAARCTTGAVQEFFRNRSLSDFLAVPSPEREAMLLESCIAALREHAGGDRPEQLCATLSFAVIEEELLLLGQLGDGMSAVLNGAGELLHCLKPERRSPRGSATWFTVSPGAADHLRLQVLDRVRLEPALLVLTSDGPLEMLRGRGGGNPIHTVRELLYYLQSGILDSSDTLGEILNQMAEVTHERLDDWSMLLWHPGPGPVEIPEGYCPRSMLREEAEKYHIDLF